MQEDEQILGSALPHSSFGDADCCGCLVGIIRGDQAQIVCNECSAVVRTVPAIDLQATLYQMELDLAVLTELCPHCGSVNFLPGFSEVIAFTCKTCGKAITDLDA